MKVFKPLVIGFASLILLSFIIGFVSEALGFTIIYSATLYLLVCVATAGHFIEENYTKAWKIEGKLRQDKDGNPNPPLMDRGFFILFSHTLVITSFLFYFPIAIGASWAAIYGLGVSLIAIVNGIVHFAILFKFRINTGCISGFFQFVFGGLTWVSLFIPLLPY